VEQLLQLSGAQDKALKLIEYAGHYLTPSPAMPAGMAQPRVRSGELIVSWIRERLS